MVKELCRCFKDLNPLQVLPLLWVPSPNLIFPSNSSYLLGTSLLPYLLCLGYSSVVLFPIQKFDTTVLSWLLCCLEVRDLIRVWFLGAAS